MSLEVGSLASKRLVSVGPDHKLVDAARRMNENKIGSVVVTVEGSNPGILTERDLLRSIAEGADAGSTLVEEYMTPIAITASASWDVHEAAQRMFDGGFRHLIVLDEEGEPAGILSLRDLLEALLDLTSNADTSEAR
ncbi:MAG: CBS domain-containing protein [Actinomycetota bacterium]